MELSKRDIESVTKNLTKQEAECILRFRALSEEGKSYFLYHLNQTLDMEISFEKEKERENYIRRKTDLVNGQITEFRMARLGAGVRKRNDGTFEKRFTINGKRYSVYGRTSKELTEKEQETRKKIEAGIYTDNRNITLDGFFEEFINNKRKHISGNAIKGYKCYYYKHISPVLGKRKVQQIERREVQNLQTALTEKLSISMVNMVMKVFKVILNEAVTDDIILKSPANGIKALKNTEPKAVETYHRALTLEEQKLFMDEVESDYLYEYLALLLCSGMRPGEGAALSWKDIDYKNKQIHIRRTLTCTEEGTVIIGDTTKTAAGTRDIPLTSTLKSILARQKKKSEVVSIDGLVFTTSYGALIYSHAANRAIADALDRLKEKGHHIERFTAHALRDTYATRFIENNGNPQTLKVLLGHTSLAMTMDLYAHVLPNTKAQETEGLDFNIAL